MTLPARSDRTLGDGSRVSALTRAAACSPHSVYGFTLVELLVVIAIIAVLIGLLLPAVQSAREAARRTQCTNHMKQLGLAALTHAEHRGHMPAQSFGAASVGSGCGPGLTSWLVPLLPFMEQTAIFDSMDHTVGMMDGCASIDTGASDMRISVTNRNARAAAIPVASLLCPSDLAAASVHPDHDAYLGTGRPAPGSYAGNGGWPASTHGIPRSTTGMIPNPGLQERNGAIGSSNAKQPSSTWHKEKIRPADFTDGMSSTALAAERRIAPLIRSLGPFGGYEVVGGPMPLPPSLGSGCGGSGSRRWLGPGGQRVTGTFDTVSSWHSYVERRPDINYSRLMGRAWASGFSSFHNVYTHVFEPNGWNGHIIGGEMGGNSIATASSQHVGGANVCFADGHVEFVQQSVDLRVWWASGSRNDGESFR